MLELVEPLLQADFLHLQQGTILDFIQRETVLLPKVTDPVGTANEVGPQKSFSLTVSQSHNLTQSSSLSLPVPVGRLFIPIPLSPGSGSHQPDLF